MIRKMPITTATEHIESDIKPLSDCVMERRACLLCGRDCRVVRKVGPLTLKEPCPNKCGAGYVHEAPKTKQKIPSNFPHEV